MKMTMQEIKEAPGPILVDFYSNSCPPCRAMVPVLEEIESAGYRVVKFDVYENMEAAQEYGVSAVPTFLVFRNGEVTHTAVGLQKKEDLLAHL